MATKTKPFKTSSARTSGGRSVPASDLEGQIAAIHRSQAVIEFDLDGTILFANENFLNALGYGLDEIRGRHHRMFVEPSYAASAEYREFWARLGRGDFETGQYKRIAKDGRIVWIQATYNPVLDQKGRPTKIVKFATDITARKNSELRAAADVVRIKGGLDVVQTNVMVADADLNVVYVNDSIKEMLATAESDIRKDVPSFNSRTVVGTNIDTFHKNPAYQRKLLAELKGMHKAQLKLGGRTFSLIL
jgi:methyl-accepting chemotaxis protein